MRIYTVILFKLLMAYLMPNYGQCQIIPYQYTVDKSSLISEFIDLDKVSSKRIASALTEHCKQMKLRLSSQYHDSTQRSIAALESNSEDVSTILVELDHLRNIFLDSLQKMGPLMGKAIQLNYLTNNKVFFPVQNSIESMLFFSLDGSGNDSKYLGHSFFAYNTTTSKLALYNELFADYFGPVRLGFGAMITGSTVGEETIESTMYLNNDDALQRLLSGGGSSVISMAYPLIQYKDVSWRKGLRVLFVPKYSLDLPVLGGAIEQYAGNTDLGLEGNAHWAGHNNNIALFFHSRVGYIIGNTQFKKQIGSNRNFILSQFNIGISFKNTIKISYSMHHISWQLSDEHLPGFLSFSLIPQF